MSLERKHRAGLTIIIIFTRKYYSSALWFWCLPRDPIAHALEIRRLYSLATRFDTWPAWIRPRSYMIFTGLGTQYTLRRDYFLDCLDDEFDLQLALARDGIWEGRDYYLASTKSSAKQISEKFDRKIMFSFVPPTSGMFVWVRAFLYDADYLELTIV